MDRRTKFILFILLAIVLFGLVGWFIVWPTIQPLLPKASPAQPPALPAPNPPAVQTTPSGDGQQQTDAGTPDSGLATFEPVASPDAAVIAGMERRAGILAERVESGSSEDGFQNLDDAQLGVSPTLANRFASMKTAMQSQYPASGSSYVTVARRLVERGESDTITGTTFNVTVQLQIQTRQDGNTSTAYKEATVTFTNTGGETWIASGYKAEAFVP